MNSLQAMIASLADGTNEIRVGKDLAQQAMVPLQKMLDFAADQQLKVRGKA